jgi:hypothetical protein
MKEFIDSHWTAISLVFVVVAAALFVFALRLLLRSRGSRAQDSGQRRARPPAVQERGPAEDRIEQPMWRIPTPPRPEGQPVDPPPQTHSWSQPRPASPPPAPGGAEPAVLGLEERFDGFEGSVTRRMDALEQRIATLERQLEGSGGAGAQNGFDRDGGRAERSYADSWGESGGMVREPIFSSPGSGSGGYDAPAGERLGVEIKDGQVVVSSSYPPEAWLVPHGGGIARVSLNPEVHHNSFALDRIARLFELGDRREGVYTTTSAAQVRWDGERGTLVSTGTAVGR